ncbi:MAG: ornithine cyclodeaminase family protein [Gemmatimonadetes bacterium]|nr:ornithine cyclodeaminase family protein [Gemmatimonadota bacterium]
MKVLVLSQQDVRRLLTMPECIELMAETLATLAKGEAVQPLRSLMRIPDAGILGMMPAYLTPQRSLGIKVLTVYPGNHGTEYDSHQGAVLFFEGEHGSLKAILDASAVTAVRTAAVSGLATRLLARPDASELAILGAGVQALTHIDAMRAVRAITRVRVWSRTSEHTDRFAERQAQRHRIPVEAMPSAEAAVRGAHIVCTATSSREPVLKGEWLSPGAHVNAAGASIPAARELDTDAVKRARLFVDRRESTLNESGDFLMPKKEGAIGDDHILGEIGDLVLGRIEGRTTPSDITVFKSLGIGVEDVASAKFVYDKAVKLNVGTSVEFGGERYDAQ